jgi:hypothetical protein
MEQPRIRRRRGGGWRAGRSCGARLLRQFQPRTRATNAAAPSHQVAVVVREVGRLDVAKARAASADAAARDAAVDVAKSGAAHSAR